MSEQAYKRCRKCGENKPLDAFNRHPERRRARQAVWKAVHRGLLVKPERCEDCGKATAKRHLHGHHHDYSKPLEVEWLCPSCHRRRHRSES